MAEEAWGEIVGHFDGCFSKIIDNVVVSSCCSEVWRVAGVV